MNPQELTNQLKSIYETKLESVVLYGSAASGEFQKGHSDYNILIALKDLAPVEIAKSNKITKKWVKNGNPLPIFFTREIINNAVDVFPIEFYDIKENHKVLYGDDPFQDIKIDPKNLRHECEHELRSKLLGLRSQLAFLSNKPKELIKLILDSSSSFFSIFKGILRLAGQTPPTAKKAVVEQLIKLIDFDPTIFMEIVDVRDGLRVWRKNDALEKFEQYLTELESVSRFVDQLATPSPL